MQLINTLLDINKLIFKFIRKEESISIEQFNKTHNHYNHLLHNTYANIETIYYNTIMLPNLQNIWKTEKESFLLCITCIIHTIMKYHGEYFQNHV